MKRILVADDHELLRRGLREMLREAFPDAEVGEAVTGAETLDRALAGGWDILLLDLNMPGRGGLETLADLRRQRPGLPVVVLSAFPEEDYALRAYRLGAAGYVSKSAAASELLTAIRRALAGGRYVPVRLVETLAAAVAGEPAVEPHQLLSDRELEVLRRIARGATTKEIGTALSLSEKTIETYRTRISRKMGLATNVDLTRYAVQHGLVE